MNGNGIFVHYTKPNTPTRADVNVKLPTGESVTMVAEYVPPEKPTGTWKIGEHELPFDQQQALTSRAAGLGVPGF